MVLILPSLFGLTLIGEGINKVINENTVGWISIIAGLGFIGLIILSYFLLSGNVTS
jgi:hypothetical protein